MFIFARSRQLKPVSAGAGLAAAVEGASKASDILGRPIFTWTSVLSPTVGTVMWSMRLDELDDAMTAGDTLAASDEFNAWITSSDEFFDGAITDVASEVVFGEPSGPPAPFISVVSGTIANGSFGEGMAVGVEIAETATRITGRETMFTAAVAGDYGAVAWLTGVPDLAALAADTRMLSSDQEWLKLVDRAGHCFAQGVTSSILRRLN